jgi:hypothetical protein
VLVLRACNYALDANIAKKCPEMVIKSSKTMEDWNTSVLSSQVHSDFFLYHHSSIKGP